MTQVLYPDHLLYHSADLWLLKTADESEALIGLSHYAQDQLGEIAYVDLPSVGSAISVGTPFGTIESMKTVSDLVSPANGTVIACNPSLAQTPTLVNQDCYQTGWLIKVKLDPAGGDDDLMSSQKYKDHIGHSE
jgi:glycine cleavage system H protein